MPFNVTLVDPPESPFGHFLFEVVRLIAYGLEDLGHSCTLTRNVVEKDRTNILVGVHHLTSADFVDDLIDSEVPYVVYQTEILRGRSINQIGLESRFDQILMPLFRNARAVWDTLDENIAALRALDVPADRLGFGYCERLQEIRHRPDKDIDFLFYGSLTDHRREVLNTLSALGYRVRVMFDDAAMFRNDLISRAEVVLSLRQSEAMAHLPQQRILYLVNNRALVVGESGIGQKPIEDLFVWGEPKDTIELCRHTRARSDRRVLAETFHQRFKERPMTAQLERLIAPLVKGEDAPR